MRGAGRRGRQHVCRASGQALRCRPDRDGQPSGYAADRRKVRRRSRRSRLYRFQYLNTRHTPNKKAGTISRSGFVFRLSSALPVTDPWQCLCTIVVLLLLLFSCSSCNRHKAFVVFVTTAASYCRLLLLLYFYYRKPRANFLFT